MKIILDFVLTAGIVLTFLIIFFVLKSRKKQEPPQLLLTLFFAVMALYLLYHYAVLHDLNILRILTFNFNAVTPLFLGPVIYLYIKSIFTDHENWLKNNFIHFIPALVFVIFISTPMLISLTQGAMIFSYLEFIAEYRKEMFTLFDIVFVAYSIVSLRAFLRYKQTLKLNYSTLSAHEYEWINYLLIGTLIISSGHLILHILSFIQSNEPFQRSYLTIISMIVLVTYLGYHGISQSRILPPNFLLNEAKSKKQDFSIDKHEKDHLKARLEELLAKDKVYLDQDLTLNKLADLIPTNNKKLSSFINRHLNTTFYEMINAHRVEAVKEKMNDAACQHLTLLGMAYDSGFNSKTSFNRIFKKETGLSPSEFKNQFKYKSF